MKSPGVLTVVFALASCGGSCTSDNGGQGLSEALGVQFELPKRRIQQLLGCEGSYLGVSSASDGEIEFSVWSEEEGFQHLGALPFTDTSADPIVAFSCAEGRPRFLLIDRPQTATSLTTEVAWRSHAKGAITRVTPTCDGGFATGWPSRRRGWSLLVTLCDSVCPGFSAVVADEGEDYRCLGDHGSPEHVHPRAPWYLGRAVGDTWKACEIVDDGSECLSLETPWDASFFGSSRGVLVRLDRDGIIRALDLRNARIITTTIRAAENSSGQIDVVTAPNGGLGVILDGTLHVLNDQMEAVATRELRPGPKLLQYVDGRFLEAFVEKCTEGDGLCLRVEEAPKE